MASAQSLLYPPQIPSDPTNQLPEILVLSSSLLTDRIFLHTGFLAKLTADAAVRVWATSAENVRFRDMWSRSPAAVERFPQVHPFREFPHNYLRRLNEFTWDFRQQIPSRLSAMVHIRDKNRRKAIQALKLPARALAMMKFEQVLEDRLEKFLLNYQRSSEALSRLSRMRPNMVFTTGPFQFEQPGIVSAAKKLGIPTLALIPSWDNLSTKNRMVFKHDGHVVWSEKMRDELHEYYPTSRTIPVYVVGASQFDVFFQPEFHQSREEFCASQGLRAELPIILYAVGSPNLLAEHFGAVDLASAIMREELGAVQMIVRPHPIHDNSELANCFGRFAPRVVLQRTAEAGTALTARSQDRRQIIEWVNTFRHCDVLVNLSSTVTVDAAIFDRPIVNLDYDPEPGHPKHRLVKDINHLWNHFKPVAESGGVWLVNDLEETIRAVKIYLKHPELHRKERRWIVDYVCGYADGRCGERMAEAVLDFDRRFTGPADKGDLKTVKSATAF